MSKYIFAHELSRMGGAWLGTARQWLGTHVNNGDSVRWGSAETITITVRQFEDCAAHIAASAINEDRAKRQGAGTV